MASLSEEMKNKRDVKRKAEVLIIDKDLGNFGLYKAILSVEYILDCAYNVQMAKQLCIAKTFDVIVIDGELGVDNFKELYVELANIYEKNMPEILVMEEPELKEKIIQYICSGAKGVISKPFSKEGMTDTIYKVLQNRRKNETRHHITIIDNDFRNLKDMKSVLGNRYMVNIINDIDVAKDYVKKRNPNLLIIDVSVLGGEECICKIIQSKEKQNGQHSHILFIADSPDADMIAKCSSFNPEGILIKPFEDQILGQTVEKILLRQSYVDDFGKR